MILVGDIGGTNTRVAIATISGTRVTLDRVKKYPSADFPSLTDALVAYVGGRSHDIAAATFGIAGPIVDNKCEATNLPWSVDAERISRTLGIPHVGLINDLESAAYGVESLQDEDVLVINKGVENPRGNRAVVSAGTGLGEAGIFYDGHQYHPFATEGGHTDFAPRNDLEFELLGFLIGKYGRISYERVVSGPGLVNIYEFFCATNRYKGDPGLEERLSAGVPKSERGPLITSMALDGGCERCAEALALFMELYGSEVGNVILKMLATGGVWLGGGIIGSVGPRLAEMGGFDRFIEAMTTKGRMSPLIEATPVFAILDGEVALRGAAVHAQRRFG